MAAEPPRVVAAATAAVRRPPPARLAAERRGAGAPERRHGTPRRAVTWTTRFRSDGSRRVRRRREAKREHDEGRSVTLPGPRHGVSDVSLRHAELRQLPP